MSMAWLGSCILLAGAASMEQLVPGSAARHTPQPACTPCISLAGLWDAVGEESGTRAAGPGASWA